MKRVFWMRAVACLLALLMLFSMVGCGETAPELPFATDAQGMQAFLDEIARLPIGTMGVSLQASLLAFHAMNWGTSTALTVDEIAQAVDDRMTSMDEAQQEMFREQLSAVASYVNLLYNEEQRAGVLENIGIENDDFGWTHTSYEKAYALAGRYVKWDLDLNVE